MDMIKKGRKMALQAVDKVQKEVQTIIQTPNQQASTYASHSTTPYQQYGQQHPPQMQNFQQQYATPHQAHQQGSHQQQHQGQPNQAQQPQYGQQPAAQQSPPIPQAYNQNQGQHGFVQQHQQYGQQGNVQQSQQYSNPSGPHVHKLPPPYVPQPVQGFQGMINPSNPQQQVHSPQQPMASPPFQQYHSPPPPPQQYQHNVTSPAPSAGSNYMTPLSQPQIYGNPSPGQFSNQQQPQSPPQQSPYQQQGYFGTMPGQPQPITHHQSPNAIPTHNVYQQAQSPVQQSGPPPPLPPGRPSTVSPPTPIGPSSPPPINQYQQQNQPQHSVQGNPPRYSTIIPAQVQQSQQPPQAHNQYSSHQSSVHANQGPPAPTQRPSQPPQLSYHQQQVPQSPIRSPQPNAPPAFQNTNQTGAEQRMYSSPPIESQPPQVSYHQQQVPQSPVQPPPVNAPPALQQANQTLAEQRMNSPPPIVSPPPQASSTRIASPPIQPQHRQQSSSVPPNAVIPPISPTIPALRPDSIHSPPNHTLTPAPLTLRPRASSNVGPPQRPVPAVSPTSQDVGSQSINSVLPHTSTPPPPAQPVRQNTPLQRNPSQPIATVTPYQAFTRKEAHRTTVSSQNSSQGQPAAVRKQSNASPPPSSQYQAFTTQNQATSQSPQLHFEQPFEHQRQSTSSPPPASIVPAAHVANHQPEQSYAAFKPNASSKSPDNLPIITAPLPYPISSSPGPVAPLFSASQQRHDFGSYSPQSALASPVSAHNSPQSMSSIISPQQNNFPKYNDKQSHAVELPTEVYEMPVSMNDDNTAQRTSQVNAVTSAQRIVEYADGLMLVDEDTSSVTAPQKLKVTSLPQHPPVTSVRKMKCAGFEPTLTDINQFFELRPEFMTYHNIPSNDGGALAVCEYCFYTFLTPHPWLADHFHARPKASRPTDPLLPQISFEKLIGCVMAFPRIRQVILGQTVPSHNLQPFIEYAKIDATLPPCTGEPQGGSYYGTKAIESIAVCSSCFECYIKNTAFERHFSLQSLASPDQQWACDIGYSGYVHRTLLQYIAQNPPNFNHFATAANKRLSMPPCTGHKQPIACSGPGANIIFRSVRDNCGVFCSGCFHDKVVGTPAEQDFGYEIEIDNDQKAVLSCDLTFEFSLDAMDNAVKSNNFDVWHAPIVANNTAKLCPSITGIDEVELITNPEEPIWYCFKDYPSIEVCAKCYGTRVVTYQAQDLFMPITRPPVAGRIRQCHLSPAKNMHNGSWDPLEYENTTAWRGQYLRNCLQYGMDAGGDFSAARQAAANIASLPPPCGSELRLFFPSSGRKFYGHKSQNPSSKNDATILMCEECFHATAKNTPMESFFSTDLTSLAYTLSPSGHRCSTWSVQTKQRLKQACLTNTFAQYAQYHHQREECYEKLWASIRELRPLNELLVAHTKNIQAQTQMNLQMGSLRLQQQMNNQMNAMIIGIGGGMVEAAASDHGQRYGNSTVGSNYLTQAGASAAMAQHNALNSNSVDNLPGLNLAMWQGASTERLTGEVKRRIDIQDELRAKWALLD